MATNPDSWLHVAQPGGNRSAALQRLLEDDAYSEFDDGRFFIYQYSEVGHRQIGLVAKVPIEAFIDRRVADHEHVDEQRVAAIVDHQSSLPLRGDLVALLFPDQPQLVELLTPVTNNAADVEIPGLLHHRIWTVPQDLNDEISRFFIDLQLYLIDGHHRVAAGIEEWKSLGKPQGFSLLCLLTPQSQLRSLSFDRRVVGPITNTQWLGSATKVEGPFRECGKACIYFDESWWSWTLQAEQPGVASIDVIRLHQQVLAPIFGINDFQTPLLEVTSEKVDPDVLRYRCDNDGGAAFLIAAPTVDQIVQVADLGEQLPPKSSYFDPKPWSGVFLWSPLD